MMTKKIGLALTMGLMLFVGSVAAHDPADGPGKPKHGGQYIEYEVHFGVEFVNKPDQLTFYMTEHLLPKEMTGSDFKVFVQSDAGTKIFKPEAVGETLVVKLEQALPKGSKIVLTGKDSDEQTIQARFVTQ